MWLQLHIIQIFEDILRYLRSCNITTCNTTDILFISVEYDTHEKTCRAVQGPCFSGVLFSDAAVIAHTAVHFLSDNEKMLPL